MNFIIDIQRACQDLPIDLPDDAYITQVIKSVLTKFREQAELSVRIVSIEEITALNQRYRHKSGPTNVLSFPIELPLGVDIDNELLGDIVIAANIVDQEAIAQQKSFISHFTHMLIHGTLHLLGFDHLNDHDATIMENHEIQIMQELNFQNPYAH